MIVNTKLRLVIAGLTTLLFTGLPAVALAAKNSSSEPETHTENTVRQEDQQRTDDSSNTGTSLASNNDSRTTDNKSRVAENKPKSPEDRLKICRKKENVINNKLSRIADRGEKQLNLFSSIAEKTQTFYTSKGKTLSNYDALVADVAAKKAEAQTAVDTVKASSVTFKCDGTDPKGAAVNFKESLKTEISALKAYKTSVKNLIVGVKSVNAKITTDGGNQ